MTAEMYACTTLVVDDNPSLREFVKGYLHTMGLPRVRTARNGEQALAIIQQEKIDLILSDAVMPGVDGLAFLETVRGTVPTRQIPFIMMSGYPDRAAVRAAVGGVTDFIVKPFTFELFEKKVIGALKRHVSNPDAEAPSAGRHPAAAPQLPDHDPEETFEDWKQGVAMEPAVTPEIERPSADVIRSILQGYDAELVHHHRTMHGKRNGRLVSIGTGIETISRRQIDELLKECVEKRITSVDVLAEQYESGLFPNVQEYASSRGIDLALKLLPPAGQNGATPADYRSITSVQVKAHVRQRKVAIEIVNYGVSSGTEILRRSASAGRGSHAAFIDEGNVVRRIHQETACHETEWQAWHDWIAAWSVDFDYDGECFKNMWSSVGHQKLLLTSAEHEVQTGKTRIAVCVIDVLGNQTIKVLEVPIGY